MEQLAKAEQAEAKSGASGSARDGPLSFAREVPVAGKAAPAHPASAAGRKGGADGYCELLKED